MRLVAKFCHHIVIAIYGMIEVTLMHILDMQGSCICTYLHGSVLCVAKKSMQMITLSNTYF